MFDKIDLNTVKFEILLVVCGYLIIDRLIRSVSSRFKTKDNKENEHISILIKTLEQSNSTLLSTNKEIGDSIRELAVAVMASKTSDESLESSIDMIHNSCKDIHFRINGIIEKITRIEERTEGCRSEK